MIDKKNCQHNWVMDGHNAGEPICSKCFKYDWELNQKRDLVPDVEITAEDIKHDQG